MRERSAKAGLNPWRFRRVMLATFSLFENASKIAIFRLKIFGCIKTFLDSLFKYYLDADRISTLPLKTFEKMCKLPNIFNLQNQQNSFFNNFLNLEKCNKSHKKKYKIALNHRLLAVFYGVSFWSVPSFIVLCFATCAKTCLQTIFCICGIEFSNFRRQKRCNFPRKIRGPRASGVAHPAKSYLKTAIVFVLSFSAVKTA